MARVRLPKHPATPSVSEDETEESASEDEVGEEELTLPVGAEAEVRNDDPGFVGSFYEVTVTGHRGRGYTVVYSTLVAEDGGPLEEAAAAADVRPRPPREERREFAVHEAVEALHNDGWWAGVVSAVLPQVAGAPRVYQVAFPTSRETMEFEASALRPHRVFQAGRWISAAQVGEGQPLFHEGTQVEVSRSEKSFGESWRPASVLKVIGATNFLVKYTHIGNNRVLATEILDSQYIRPAHTARKYRFSRSSRIEVMHEGSWWPGVIMEVPGSGIENKYVVKLKSHETDIDVLTVENTQLRPQFCWDRKNWLRSLEKKSATVPTLASRKRPISSGLSLHKEVGETSDEHGSHHEKKLKNAELASETIPPLSVVFNQSSEIKRHFSSYPEETAKQGNAMFAPPSLPLMAGFSHLSGSSLAQSSHLKQAYSQKIITPCAPVPQSLQLQGSLFGTFGQTRRLPLGPLLGMRSLNPQSQKEVIAAKSIEEARNTVSMSGDLAKLKDVFDDVELRYNVTAGHGMFSEINTANCVDPSTAPKDAGGSQHAVSQQGGGSTMDNRLSESLAIKHLPFVKTSPLWPHVETMEILHKAPQRPHLNQLRRFGPAIHEKMTLESINRLDVKDDIAGLLEKMQVLSMLEANGFDVGALRSQLEALLRRKNMHHTEPHNDDDMMKTLEEKIAHKEAEDRELGARMRVLAMALHQLRLYASLVRDMVRSAVAQKMSNATEISRLKSTSKRARTRSEASTSALR